MKLSFDLIGAGVLAPGIDTVDRLIERVDAGLDSESSRAPTNDAKHSSRAAGASRPVLAEEPFDLPSPIGLPPNERRRASAVVRLVLACAEQALARQPGSASRAHLVCAADEGVGDVCQQMLDSLAHDRPLSPLVFTNSVHNAPSGYLSIAHGNQRPATSLSLGPQSFACGLLCAVVEATTAGEPVLFMNYDSPMPMPLRSLLAIARPSATAWLIVAPVPRPGTVPASDSTSMGDRHHDPARPRRTTSHGKDANGHLASFRIELMAVDAPDGPARADAPPHGVPVDHRPDWLVPSWATNSSALGIAALGLLARPGGARDFSLGRQVLRLCRIEP